MKLVLEALVLRPIRGAPSRFFVTVIGVAVGIASVIATLSASRAAVSSMREGVEQVAGQTAFEIAQPGGLPEGVLGELRPLARDALLAPVVEDLVLLPTLDDTVRLLGLDLLLDRGIRDLEITQGSEEGTVDRTLLLRGEGLALPESLAKELGVRVGDSLEMLIRAKRVSRPVVGLFRPDRFAAVWDRILIADIALAQELCGKNGRIDRIEITPREGVSLSAVRNRAETLIGDRYQIGLPSERAQQTGRMVRALEFNLTALAGISLLVGAVLVATTLATSIVQRRTILALMRSLGGSSRQVVGILLSESLLIGLCGGVLGVIGGAVGAQMAHASVRSTVAAVVRGAPASRIEISGWEVALGLALGVAVSLLASILPLREALKTPPIQNLRKEHPERLGRGAYLRSLILVAGCGLAAVILTWLPPVDGDLPVAALFAALFLMLGVLFISGPAVDAMARFGSGRVWKGPASAVRLAAASLSASRRRAAWAAGAIGVAVALAIAMATMVDSFRRTVVDWTEQSLRSDLWLRPAKAETGVPVGRLDPEIVRIAVDLFGWDAVDPFYSETAFYQGKPVSLSAGEIPVVQKHGGIPFKEGRSTGEVLGELLDKQGAIINEPFQTKHGLRRGDILRLDTPGGTLERPIVGVFLDYGNQEGRVVIDRRDFLDHYPDDGPDGIAFFFPEDTDVAASRDRLRAALAGRWQVEMLLNRELRAEVLRVFDQTFAITTAMQAVASTVAVIAVLTVLFALLSERHQDLALLRAIGGDRRQVGMQVVWQSGLLGFLGAATGLVSGLLVGWVLVKVVNLQSFGWTLRFLVPWGSLATILCGVVLACFLAGLVPAFSAMRTAPSQALREES
jgi:putative ABC transport system permease protein